MEGRHTGMPATADDTTVVFIAERPMEGPTPLTPQARINQASLDAGPERE